MKGSEDKAPQTLKSEVAEKEEKILEFWNSNQIFKKSLEKDSPNGNFVFYDGPPFATGMPHYGHVLPGTIKDLIPRYQTMRGKKVLRRWGWDCHGLPIENLIEKELGLKSKKDIEKLGVEKFNLAARNVVFRYVDEWKKIIPRSGRWVDMENSYQTMDSTYTESVWWSFKTLYEKGLIYQGFRVMLFCPHDETTLSNFEVNLGYKDITDISVYVKFELVDEPKTFILAWTTTPWTLPGNVALAVNKDITYVKAKKDNISYIVSKDLAEKVLKENYEIEEEFSGKKLLGKSYTPVFDYYKNENLENKENAWKIYHGDFVTTETGTGVVHIAPAFGEDDYELSKKEKLPFIQHVNRDGTFKKEVPDFSGQQAKPIDDPQKADIEIIKYLAKKEVLFAKEKIVHSYPHCWRCGTPLLNYATTSWFIKVTDFKDKLIKINNKVSWTPPEIGEGRFGKWLEGARDWNISRSRYWGAPLPVWESEAGERTVMGSIGELKDYIGRKNKYFVMRHGETEGNLKRIWNTDSNKSDPLTKEGEKKVIENAKTLSDKSIDLIICSPYVRTKETAELVFKELGLTEGDIITDKRLGEWNVGGEFNNSPVGNFFTERNKSQDRYGFKAKDGESYEDVVKRSGEFIYDIDKKYSGKNILIITHGGPARALSIIGDGISYKGSNNTRAGTNFVNAEIREIDFVELPHNENYEIDLHRPYIDEVLLKDKSGNALKRIPEIFDTWYDSGSMSFAQQHYPFKNKEEFEKKNSSLFPADFIAEGLDQTRGWFYTLLVMSVGLFDQSAYEHVLVNGLVLAEDGRKMSKSLNNYPDLMEIINKYGADSLRYYLMSSPLVKAEDFNFSEKGVDEIYKKLIQKLYNVVSFYEMYPVEGEGRPKETILDTWILSRLNELNKTITTHLDKYELDKASRPILDFIDDLSTWYLRRSRDRFKSEDKTISYCAFYYTTEVLRQLSKLMAPFMPFLAEEVYKKAKGELESVHLENWPDVGDIDEKLLNDMRQVRNIVSNSLEKRQKSGLKVRQPLASISGVPKEFSKGEFAEIIKEEVNVKDLKTEGTEISLDINITSELKNEGMVRDIIRGIQEIRKIENLTPNDKIKLVISTDNNIESIINNYESIIKSTTKVSEFTYSKEKQTHDISLEGTSLSISLVK